MKFWIHRNGEKQGPIEDYEVRAMIREGEVERDTLVWFNPSLTFQGPKPPKNHFF